MSTIDSLFDLEALKARSILQYEIKGTQEHPQLDRPEGLGCPVIRWRQPGPGVQGRIAYSEP